MARNAEHFKKLLFIGSGKIASAVACGLVSSGTIPADYVTVYNRNSNKFAKFEDLGIKTSLNLEDASKDADFIFLAVKPNVVKSVMEQLSLIDGLLERVIIVSFAASVTMDHIEKAAGREVSVIRTMPSTPITIGEGILAVTKNENVSAKDFQYLCRMMSNIAYVTVIEEDLMNPIISVQGSSPAYVYLFVKAMLDAAEAQGFSKDTALPLILKTIKGSVSMIEKSGDSIEKLINDVTSPNGTTFAALNSFESDDFCGAVLRAMNACTNRANEISEEL